MKMLKMPPLSQWFVFSLLLLLLSPTHFISNQLKLALANGLCSSKNETDMGMKLYPLIDQKKMKEMLVMNETRRKLGSYKICALCTCCGARGYCLPSPCCYAINCNIPNRPFGFCSFTPRACNCFGCHL